MRDATNETLVITKERELTTKERELRGAWEAIHFVDRLAKNKHTSINEQNIRNIHKRVMGYFHADVAGKYRNYELEISRAVIMPPHWSQVRGAMFEFGKDLEERTSRPNRSIAGIEDAISTSAWAHYQVVRIHPFADGNGRTARFLADLILKRASLYYITDWGSHSNEYLDALKRVDKSGDIGFFGRFLGNKLAKRYEEMANILLKSSLAKQAKGSPILNDLYDRRNELLRIAEAKNA